MDTAVFRLGREGSLAKVPGSPYKTDFGFSVVVSPDAKTAYIASLKNNSITGYRIGAQGSLTPLPGAKIVAETPVIGLALTPDGKRLFATIGGLNGKVRSYDVAASGELRPSGAPEFRLGGGTLLSLPAVTPDGKHLYVAGIFANNVYALRIGKDGTLTQLGDPVPTGNTAVLPSITPDGRFLYITNENSENVSGFAIGANGRLTPTPGSPYATGGMPHGVAITADSRRLYLPEAAGGDIPGFAIGADGRLTPLPGSPYPGPRDGNMPGLVRLSPDGSKLFVIDVLTRHISSRIYTYAVNPDGSLTESGLPAVDTGVVFSDGPATVITPNLGPVAALKATGGNGRTRTFSARESRDPDGTVAAYRWTFGDGTSRTTTSPTVSHTYAAPGRHTVSVTVTDDENCSTDLFYTGQTVHCGGGDAARATTEVAVD
ncbi:PKD domain-containing protein [Actinocorallia sp. API 0066]|nr:PKD domain-containing protein [Actinocorallia sp. API 0066]